MTDNGTPPESLTTRRAYDLLADGFGPGFNGPLLLSVELDGADRRRPRAARRGHRRRPRRRRRSPRPGSTPTARPPCIRVIPTTSPQDEATTDLVHRLRDDVIPPASPASPASTCLRRRADRDVHRHVRQGVVSRLPWFIGAVIVLSVLLLMVVFRSIAVPLKAAVMNLLSIGAAYGVIVAVFQWGWLKGLFGVEETVPDRLVHADDAVRHPLRPVDGLRGVPAVPGAGGVPAHAGTTTLAVIEGIAATARVITSAALIMISVFAAFVLGDDPDDQDVRPRAWPTAVLIDATIVRIVLVPATMNLLGDWNWWLPRLARPAPAQPRHRGRQRACPSPSSSRRTKTNTSPSKTASSSRPWSDRPRFSSVRPTVSGGLTLELAGVNPRRAGRGARRGGRRRRSPPAAATGSGGSR